MSSNVLTQKAALPAKELWLLERQEKQRQKLLNGTPSSTTTAAGGGSSAVASLAAAGAVVVAAEEQQRQHQLQHQRAAAASSASRRPATMVEYEPGEVAPMEVGLYGTRESTLLAAIDHSNAESKRQARILKATTTIQSAARMLLDRRRFTLHRTRVKAEIAAIIAQRNMRCAITVQRCARGLVCRLRYRRQREEEAMAALEASKAKGGRGKSGAKAQGKAAGGPTASGLNALLSPQELALQQNASFIKATRAYWNGSLDEALAALEQQQRSKPEPVTAAFLDLVRRKRNGTTGGGASSPNVLSQSSTAAATTGTKRRGSTQPKKKK